jgi:hypothetical protein
MNLRFVFGAGIGLAVLLACASQAAAQPALTSVSPLAVAPGKTTELTLTGAGLAPPFSVWTSFAATAEMPSDGENATDQAPKKCRLTLAPETAVGVGAIVIGGAGGATEPFLILIDDLPSIAEQDSNRTLASAQVVALPTAIDGSSQAGASDYFKFTAAAGQRLAFDVYAARIGSPLDPVIWLRDAAGAELAYGDDDPGAGADCRITHTFAAAGEYVLEIRDNRYQAGHRYRVRIGDFPIVSTSYPLAARAGSTASVALVERGASPIGQVVAARADDPVATIAGDRVPTGAGVQRLAHRGANSNASGLATLAIGDLYEAVEAEPNDTVAQAAAVTAPCAVNGRFEAAGDKDHFRFAAKKGERLIIKSTGRRLGASAAAALRVVRLDGMTAAEAPAPADDDTSLSFAVPDDGEYVLEVADMLGLFGADRAYRVEIGRHPGFRIDVKGVAPGRDRYAAAGAFAVDLVCARDGYDGPLTISAETTAGQPLVAYSNLFAAGQNEGKVIFATGADWTAGQVRTIRIFATPEPANGQPARMAGTTALLRARWPQQAFPASWLDGLVYVGVLPKAPELYVLKTPAEAPPLAAAATETSFVLTPERKDANFKEPLVIAVTNLPPGVTYAVTREGDPPADKYTVKLTCPAGLAAGDYRIRVFAYGELNGVGQPITAEIVLHKAAP